MMIYKNNSFLCQENTDHKI